jgi:putative acetyltransferase
MLIRQELDTDLDTIDSIHDAAFAPMYPDATPVEAALVRALRRDPGWVPALSLVAEDRPDGTGAVVGHVVCTEGSVGDTTALGLGPVGVAPSHQAHGVGTALLHAVLGAADALGYPVVVLLGHPDYYPRFGFVPATSIGIEPSEPAWADHFQARRLGAWTPAVQGTFRYAAPFDEL